MTNDFKSSWTVAPRSQQESWKRGVTFEVSMLPDEVDGFGATLMATFPKSLIYSRTMTHDRNPRTAYRSPHTHGIITPSLLDAAKATNSAYAYFRYPWPEDFASGDPDRIQNYRDAPVLCGHDIFRRIGRCLQISWSTGYTFLNHQRIWMERDGKGIDCELDLISSRVTIHAIYDNDDEEVLAFLKEVEALIFGLTSCDFASYDPFTGELINPNRRDASQRRSAGVVRYAGLHEKTYFGFCNKLGKPHEVMSVRPEVRAALRAEAGMPIAT